MYYRPTKAEPKVQEHLLAPIKAMIEENPSFGYRTVAHLLEFNKNTVQPIFQIKGWQVRKWPVGFRPRIKALLSVAQRPNERCATDLCRIWAERDDWTTLALVIDCLPPRAAGLAPVSPRPIEDRGIGARARVDRSIRDARQGATALPSEIRQNGLVFTSRSYTALVRGDGLCQEFITPYSPEQNGMVERVIRTLKEQCAHRHRFESLQHASRTIGDWIGFYNNRRPHQTLGM